MSSDSGLYYDDSDDASQAAGSAAHHHPNHQFRHPVIDQSSGKTKQSQGKQPKPSASTSGLDGKSSKIHKLNKELERRQSGLLRDFQSDNEGDTPGTKNWLNRESQLRAVDIDAVSQLVSSKQEDVFFFDNEQSGPNAIKKRGVNGSKTRTLLEEPGNQTNPIQRSDSGSEYDNRSGHKKGPGGAKMST